MNELNEANDFLHDGPPLREHEMTDWLQSQDTHTKTTTTLSSTLPHSHRSVLWKLSWIGLVVILAIAGNARFITSIVSLGNTPKTTVDNTITLSKTNDVQMKFNKSKSILDYNLSINHHVKTESINNAGPKNNASIHVGNDTVNDIDADAALSFSSSEKQSSLHHQSISESGSMIVNDMGIIKSNSTGAYSLSIVVQFRGQMGNQLHSIAHARAIQLLARDVYGIETNLVFKQADPTKGRNADHSESSQRYFQKCFPNLRQYDYQLGNSEEFQLRLEQQQQWLGKEDAARLHMPKGMDLKDIHEVLTYIQTLLERSKNDKTYPNNVPTNSSITMPFLWVESFMNHHFIDLFYNDYRSFFEFDHSQCCADLPDPDESVLHLRGFGPNMGVKELPPTQVAREMFGPHLPLGSKVALVTRFDETHSASQRYTQALTEYGYKVRIANGPNHAINATNNPQQQQKNKNTSKWAAMHDFCFLLQTKYQLVGLVHSTFLIWGALLGNAERVQWYSINSSSNITSTTTIGTTHDKTKQRKRFVPYNWTHPDLKKRIHFEIYTLNEDKEKEPKPDTNSSTI